MTTRIQLLTFTLGPEVYAIDVSRTREVVEFSNITPIRKTPGWIRGVLNLRGTVVPVLDLKQKLMMGITEKSLDACILILDILLDGERVLAGMLVPLAKSLGAFWRRCAGRLRRRGPPRFLGVSPRTPRPLRGRLVPPWESQQLPASGTSGFGTGSEVPTEARALA